MVGIARRLVRKIDLRFVKADKDGGLCAVTASHLDFAWNEAMEADAYQARHLISDFVPELLQQYKQPCEGICQHCPISVRRQDAWRPEEECFTKWGTAHILQAYLHLQDAQVPGGSDL